MTYINYNYAANVAANAIGRNDRALDSAMNRISTGVRVGNGQGEMGMYSQYVEYKSDAVLARQGVENVNRGLGMMKLIEGQATIMGDIMIRMHELATAATNTALQASDRHALDGEFMALGKEAGRIAAETRWNNNLVMSAGSVTIDTMIGTGVVVNIDDFSFDSFTATTGAGVATMALLDEKSTGASAEATGSINVMTEIAAADGTPITGLTSLQSVGAADAALTKLNLYVPRYAAAISRLGGQVKQVEFAADSMSNLAVNLEAATSQIRDADYAVETAKLASAQVISQAATAMVAQANARSTSVLALLQ